MKRSLQVAVVLLALASPAYADILTFEVTFTGSDQVPTNTTYTFDTVTHRFGGFLTEIFGHTFDCAADINTRGDWSHITTENHPLLMGGDGTWQSYYESGNTDPRNTRNLLSIFIGSLGLNVSESSPFDPQGPVGIVRFNGSVSIRPVVEPETLSLLAIGLGGILLIGVLGGRAINA